MYLVPGLCRCHLVRLNTKFYIYFDFTISHESTYQRMKFGRGLAGLTYDGAPDSQWNNKKNSVLANPNRGPIHVELLRPITTEVPNHVVILD